MRFRISSACWSMPRSVPTDHSQHTPFQYRELRFVAPCPSSVPNHTLVQYREICCRIPSACSTIRSTGHRPTRAQYRGGK
eukprot:3522754-Rhodomonas_salina.1